MCHGGRGVWRHFADRVSCRFGSYVEIKEDNFLQEVTTTEKCVVHFFHPDFQR